MVVQARDLPSARRRRLLILGIGGLVALTAIGWSVRAAARVAAAARGLAAVEHQLTLHQERADKVAEDCGLVPFTSEEALEHFPMKLSARPTREERACAKRVTEARADLIDDHLKLEELTPAVAVDRSRRRTGLWLAAILTAAWAAALYLLEIRPRRAGLAG